MFSWSVNSNILTQDHVIQVFLLFKFILVDNIINWCLQHKEICAFPSQYFYEDKLESPKEVEIEREIWPNRGVPMVFINVVDGFEETQVLSSEEGNELSKSNPVEVEEIVSFFCVYLISVW